MRSFEAAARHESFVTAAEELGVTAGAVAQQVKSLEAWFGQELFVRHSHGVRLTEQARAALPELVAAFDSLGGAVRSLKELTRTNKIMIAALPAVAQLWLTPRLPRLYKAFPDVEISISALEELPNLNRELYDLALFLSDVGEPDDGIELTVNTIQPVCSPALLSGGNPLNKIADLDNHILLHDAKWKDDWSRWLAVSAEILIDPMQGPSYSLYSLAVQAAIDGAGVLMGHEMLIRDALDDGRLVAPFQRPVPSGQSLKLFLPDGSDKNSQRQKLVNWLLDENR